MRCLRFAFGFTAAAFAVIFAEAQPQQPVAVPTPLAVALLSAVDDPAVVADLKLKDEQVKALVARRTELWDEAYTTAPNKFNEGTAARNEATDALLKKTLTADQYKRAVQLGAQSVLNNRGGFGGGDGPPTFRLVSVPAITLNRYPELAAALKLTDDQKKQLAAPLPKGTKGGGFGGGGRAIIMSKEQQDAGKEFLGTTAAKTWQAKFDPRFDNQPFAPTAFNLLEAKDVRADVKVSDDAAKVFAALSEKWQDLQTGRNTTLSDCPIGGQETFR